jgi:hypothetical protein
MQKHKFGITSFEKLHVLKNEDEIYKLLGEILFEERKKIAFSYSAKSDVWSHPYLHIMCICTIQVHVCIYAIAFELSCSSLG